jgi:competence protein ComEC
MLERGEFGIMDSEIGVDDAHRLYGLRYALRHLANFWKSGWVAKVVTIFVSLCAMCCMCTSALLALPTPTSDVAGTGTQTLVADIETQAATLNLGASVKTTATVPTVILTDSPTASLVPSETATVVPTKTVVPSKTATVLPTVTFTPTLVPTAVNQPFRVHFIDVGQGDAILIQTTDGKNVLIDGGDTNTGVVGYLKSAGVQQIDLMIATHPHADHIGGLVQVLQALPVLKVVTNGQPHTTSVYEDFLDAIADSQAEYVEVKRGDVLEVGNLKLNVLSPVTLSDPDLNENSIVLRFNDGRTTYLMMGDAGANTEATLLASGMPLKANILKVGHHGSSSGSTLAFLQAVAPDVAVYSAGANNQYGHPALQTIRSLNQVGATTYGTNVNGTVTVKGTAQGYEVQTQKVELAALPTATFRPLATSAPAAGLTIESVTSPVAPGDDATLTAQTSANASCQITVYYKSGPSKAKGLTPRKADANGFVSWTWVVGTNTTPGTWRIVVTCDKITRETVFTVQR